MAETAPAKSDPRLQGDPWRDTHANTLFTEPTEAIAPLSDVRTLVKADANEDACSLRMTGYPVERGLQQVADYFAGIAMLRKVPKRMDDGGVVVMFQTARDLEFVLEWFPDLKDACVEGNRVSIERVGEEARTGEGRR